MPVIEEKKEKQERNIKVKVDSYLRGDAHLKTSFYSIMPWRTQIGLIDVVHLQFSTNLIKLLFIFWRCHDDLTKK